MVTQTNWTKGNLPGTYHQLVGDLGGHHAEGQDVHRGVLGEDVLGRLLGNHQGGQHHQRERDAGRQDTGALREYGEDYVRGFI